MEECWKGYVPAAPFVEIIREAVEETGDQKAVAARMGLSVKSLYRMRYQNQISFDNADRIVTYLKGPMTWWEDPVLNEIYLAANLSGEPPPPTDEEHGFRGTYVNKGCRCSECKKANAVYWQEYRKKREAA